MKYLIDSHLLVYILDKQSIFFRETSDLFRKFDGKEIKPVVAQQNILEATNTFVNKYKKGKKVIIEAIDDLLDTYDFSIISPLSTTYPTFTKIYLANKKTSNLFDCYLAATMMSNGIERIWTVNTKDFKEIEKIEAMNPFK